MAKYACRTAPNYDYDERYSTYRALQLGGGFIVGVQCPFPPALHESSRLSRQSTPQVYYRIQVVLKKHELVFTMVFEISWT